MERFLKFFLRGSKGFSLLEITVVLFILAIGFAAVLSLVTKSVTVSTRLTNEVIAANLAAEGVELLVNVRHTNWLEGCPYDDFDSDGGGPIVDCVSDTIPDCPLFLNTNIDAFVNPLRIADDPDDLIGIRIIRVAPPIYLYTHNYTTPNPQFRRRIELCRSINDGVSRVESTAVVYWDERGATRSVEVTEHLYDWKP